MPWRWKSWLCFTLTNNSKFPSQFLGVDSLLHIARWAASPVFAILLPARTTDQPNGGWSLTNPMWWKKSEDIWCRKSAVSQRNERNDANIHTCEDWISVGDIPGCTRTGTCRHFLQKWRKHIDFLIMSVRALWLWLLVRLQAHCSKRGKLYVTCEGCYMDSFFDY